MKSETLKKFLHPIHREGYIFIAIAFILTFVLFFISDFLGTIGVIMTIYTVYFFRDPERNIPQDDKLITSPADGLIDKISEAPLPKDINEDADETLYNKISIFLSVFDVHVNRIPISGEVKMINYHKGKFMSAELDKSSEENERNSILMEDENGKKYGIVQIAGLIARRIVCTAKEEQKFEKGERFGIIRFGSRVDLYFPKTSSIRVALGQKVIGGETIIAELNSRKKNIEAKLI